MTHLAQVPEIKTSDGSVLYLCSFLPTYISWEVSELMRRGVRVHVGMSAPYARGTMWDAITGLRRGGDGPGCLLRTLDYYSWLALSRPAVAARAVGLLPALFRAPGRARLARRSVRERSGRHLLAALWLADQLRDQKIARVHAHFVGDVAEVALLLGELLGVPFTVTAHANDIFVPRDRERFRRVLERASQVFTISEFNRKYLEASGAACADRIRVIRLGVDLSALPSREPHGRVPFHLMCTASGLTEKKGIRFLIAACALLKRRAMPFRCTIAGADPHGVALAQLQHLRAAADLDAEVTFAGAVPWPALVRQVAAADAFVLPCVQTGRGEMDGIPVALIEAMGIGVPVVSTPVSGIPELIEDGVNGYLVPPADAGALADVIQRIAARPQEAARISARARHTVARDFSLTRYVDELLTCWSIETPGVPSRVF